MKSLRTYRPRFTVHCILFTVYCSLFTVHSNAQQTNNHELRAIPARTPIVLDGLLDEWDLSGEILMCYDLATLLDTHSVRVAAMYDADYLYLSFRFKDRRPMINNVDPDTEHNRGWRADAVQLRIWTDHEKPVGPGGARITHIDCWYATLKGAAAGQIVHHDISRQAEGFEGEIRDVIGKGVDAAFKKDADEKGYTQEMRVAWKHLRRDGRPYVAGDALRMGIEAMWGNLAANTYPMEHRYAGLVNPKHPSREFFWSNHDAWGFVRFMDHGNLAPSPSVELAGATMRLQELLYSTSGPVEIEYEIPSDGFATLVIDKPDGTRVRNLISNYPRKKGKNTDTWDGADDNGHLVPAGEYRVRGLFHEALDVTYEFSYGNAGNPPWDTADGTGNWLSDHTHPMDVLTDDEGAFLIAPHSENGSTLIGLDPDGNRLWSVARRQGGYMAKLGDYIYVVADHGSKPAYPAQKKIMKKIKFYSVEARTGRLGTFNDGQGTHDILEYNRIEEGFARPPEGKTIADRSHNPDWANIMAQGMAAHEGMLYISLYFRDKLIVVDPEEGWIVDEIPLHRPSGVASDGRRLLVVSGDKVVVVDPDSKSATDLIVSDLAAPIGLAVDTEANVYVSDWADQMCVKKFSPDGRLVQTFGKIGGRPWMGPYDPSGMILPRGISVDPQGRLWVAEDYASPRRMSCWNPDGSLAFEKYGTTWYSGDGCYIFPDQPERAFFNGAFVDLDWDRGLWRMRAVPWAPTHEDALLGVDNLTIIKAVREVNGRTYIVHTQARFGLVVISRLEGDLAVPVAALGSCSAAIPNIHHLNRGTINPHPIFADHLWTCDRMNEEMKKVVPWFYDSPSGSHTQDFWWSPDRSRAAAQAGCPDMPPNNNFIWSDRNGNGRMDADEMVYHPTPDLPSPAPAWGASAWGRDEFDDELTLFLTGQMPAGVHRVWRLPVAEWIGDGVPVYKVEDAELIIEDRPIKDYSCFSWRDSKGNLMFQFHPLTMFSADGSKKLWTFPNPWPGVHGSHTAPQAQRGRFIGGLKVIGSADVGGDIGEVFCFSGNLGQAFLFTTDGLYVGELFKDARSAPDPLPSKSTRGMSVMNTTCGGEWFGGQFFRNCRDRKIYLVNHHSNINQVHGLDSMRRIPAQTVALNETLHSECADFMAQKAADEQEKHQISIASIAKEHTQGELPAAGRFTWGEGRQAKWSFDGNSGAKATWSYDDTHLYVAFDSVKDATPMINGGKDWRQLFKTGDSVVFDIRTNPDEESDEVKPGDLRLLFSVFDGKPLAVLYRYRVPGTRDPVEFSSGLGTTHVDEVRILKEANVAFDRRADGYTARAAIPLADLEWAIEPGKSYPGDFGVIYSDRAGQANVLRMFWANPVTSFVNDMSLEAMIEPRFWGRFEVKGE